MKEEYIKAKKLLEDNGIEPVVRPRTSKERNNVIINLFSLGMTVSELSRVYEVSRQRISQILFNHGVDTVTVQTEHKSEKLIKQYEEKIAKLKAKVRHNGEVFKAEHLKVLQLQQKLVLRDKKLAKVENFTQQLEEYRFKNLSLSSQLGRAKARIEELEKEIKELKGQRKTFIIKKK